MSKYEVTVLAVYGATITVEADGIHAAREAVEDLLATPAAGPGGLGELNMKYRDRLPMEEWVVVPKDISVLRPPPGSLTFLRLAHGSHSRGKAGILSVSSLGYRERQKHAEWSYAQMTQWAGLSYGPLAEFCLLVGNYMGKVCNDGHTGYEESPFSGTSRESDEPNLHGRMIVLMKFLGADQSASGERMLGVMVEYLALESKGSFDADSDENFEEVKNELKGIDERFNAAIDDYEKWLDNQVRLALKQD